MSTTSNGSNKRVRSSVSADTRRKVFQRDFWRCTRCGSRVTEETGHIDHIVSGKLAGNEMENLRVLCRKCHCLRLDSRHRGMIANAIRDGVIGPDWRAHVWEEGE